MQMQLFERLVRSISFKGLRGLRILLVQLLASILPYNFETTAPTLLSYDFIVVGSGPGGSVMASRLSETGAQVLLLEAGASAAPETAVPGLFPAFSINDEAIFRMRSRPLTDTQTALRSNSMNLYQAKVMGGGSTINSMIYSRGSPHDYDNWANMGNEGWDYQSVLPYFKKIEHYDGYESPVTDKYHGRSGPIRVSKKAYVDPIMLQSIDAFGELGYRPINDGLPNQIGIAPMMMTVKDGVRETASESYLKPVADRTNLHIRTNCMVVKIHFNNKKQAIGVDYKHKGELKFVRARKEVIISAGVMNSPKLLMLSGIGPEQHIRELGIPLVAAVEGVGKNLQDHVNGSPIPFTVKPNVVRNPGNPLEDFQQYIRNRTGSLATPPGYEYSSYISLADENKDWADLNVYMFKLTGVEDRGIVSNIYMNLKKEYFDAIFGPVIEAGGDAISMNVLLLRPKSSGWVKLRSTDPEDVPIIDYNYFANIDDLKVLVKGVQFAIKKLLQTTIMRDVIGARLVSKPIPGCENMIMHSDEYWECHIRAAVYQGSYSVGTCKMAPDSDPMGVVDSRLRLRGVSGVRIVDASSIPRVTTGKTMATVYMVGEKGADLVKEDWGYETDALY